MENVIVTAAELVLGKHYSVLWYIVMMTKELIFCCEKFDCACLSILVISNRGHRFITMKLNWDGCCLLYLDLLA